jgi:hypothetical protein
VSAAALFAMGVLVTLVWGAGLSLLVYGAILDGRYEAQRKAVEAEDARGPRPGRRPSAAPDDTSTEAGDVPAAA